MATTPAGETVYAREVGSRVVLEIFAVDGKRRPFAEYEGGLPGHGSQPLSVAVDDAGFVHVLVSETVTYVEGVDFEPPTEDQRLVVLRYASDGVLEWRRERERPPVAEGQQFIADGQIGADGDVIHVLELDESPGVFRLDTGGQALSEATLAAPADMSIRAHDLASDGAPVLAGHAWDGKTVTVWVGRFALDGSLVWSDRFADNETDVTAVVTGWDGDTFLASYAFPNPETYEVVLRRYDANGQVTASSGPLETSTSATATDATDATDATTSVMTTTGPGTTAETTTGSTGAGETADTTVGDGFLPNCFDLQPSDTFDIVAAQIVGDELVVEVGYSGGCEPHDFTLCFDSIVLDTQYSNLAIDHDAHGDNCKAFIMEIRKFDLTPLQQTGPSPFEFFLLGFEGDSFTYEY
ncbi:MAG: hypothetical protein IPO88_00755 [Nannocystis sp.]|uniref:hypothetical protein n=1 Tax=Nannocystis sp. TaxID=1962667 RepID=UPI002424E2B1|nr:hypothetical protein [Nannocystis sp.]MBK9752032.1 hypothetical protein [Nannocystis sp.]